MVRTLVGIALATSSGHRQLRAADAASRPSQAPPTDLRGGPSIWWLRGNAKPLEFLG
jgi:hypothetical protein